MNGAQDLGGAHGFGPVVPEPGEPAFHADWERRVFGMAMAMGYAGAWNLDASRFARESLPPAQYLSSSYFEIWLAAMERDIAARGYASPEEMRAGTASEPAKPLPQVAHGDDLVEIVRAGALFDRPPAAPARFAPGDAVVTRNMHPLGHTRLPRYARGRRGRIEDVRGAFVYPDTNAHGRGEGPEWLYTVSFTARELWGESGEDGGTVQIAAFEPYLDPA